jgi:hypothetical protein
MRQTIHTTDHGGIVCALQFDMDQSARGGLSEQIDMKVTYFGQFDIMPALNGKTCDGGENAAAGRIRRVLRAMSYSCMEVQVDARFKYSAARGQTSHGLRKFSFSVWRAQRSKPAQKYGVIRGFLSC